MNPSATGPFRTAMISTFRRFFQSKIGIVLTMAFLALIAFAFASMDVSSTGTFGGVSGSNSVAVVGDEDIGTGELVLAVNNAIDQARQQDPTITMETFIAQGGLEAVLSQMIDRAAIAEYAREHGLRAGENLVNSEIMAIPAFRGADGNFSDQAYRQALAQIGLTDAMVREDLASGLLAQQVLIPASLGAQVPAGLTRRYAAMQMERREGAIGFVPSAAFAPEGDPTAQQLQAFYQANRADYIRPERRVIRYASFDAESLGDRIEPTDAEITAYYQENRAQFQASEERGLTQLIVPTEQAAQAIRSRVQGGGSLEEAAQEAGFDIVQIEPLGRAELASQTNAEVAEAVFAASENAISVPRRGALGWYVVRVDSVERTPARSLAQARDEIADTLRQEKRRTALSDLSVEIQTRFDEGESLTEAARELDLDVQTTPPPTAAGQVYGTQDMADPILAPVLQTAFQMTESEPQIAEVERGQTFVLFDVARITQSAAAPLAEIREEVTAAWRLSQGERAANQAADRILARLRAGASMAEAVGQEEAPLPDPEIVDLTREQLAAGQQRVAAPVAPLFSMAQGTSKKLEGPENVGWFVVDLDEIEPGTIAADDPFLASARQQIGALTGREYAQQLQAAMRAEVGVERNQAAFEAVRQQLLGTN